MFLLKILKQMGIFIVIKFFFFFFFFFLKIKISTDDLTMIQVRRDQEIKKKYLFILPTIIISQSGVGRSIICKRPLFKDILLNFK